MRHVNLCISTLAAAVAALALTSCREDLKRFEEIFVSDLPDPQKIITVNNIVKYPRARELEKEVFTVTGMKVWVNTNSFIHSKSIKDIDLVPRDPDGNFYDLKLHLDNHGKLVWMQLSAGHLFDQIALLIDNVFYRTFTPKPMGEGEDFVIIEGPFDRFNAQEIKKYAKNNYNYFNKD
ncbi:MAG: hypothetical protein JW808_04430 [Victivallales bacterium]|nr:hypothetical protein [Victivallales bacterium]